MLGEVLQQVESADKLNTSVAMVYQWADGKKSEDDLPGALGNWVNVDQGASIVLTLSATRIGRVIC